MIPHLMQPKNLILASQSQTRMRLLNQAGLRFTALASTADEEDLKITNSKLRAPELAQCLALAKAKSINGSTKEDFILGADQTLSCNGKVFSKPRDRNEAREHLKFLRGRTHFLHTAMAVVNNQSVVFEHLAEATLTMRAFSDVFLENYLDSVDEGAINAVGCYHYEAQGIQLFETVEGDYFTILGLSLLPLLAFLRQTGITNP